ncbi:MAG: hypothetical protein AB8G18_05080 [Gammaproteobacteria bacterium]
MKKQKIIFLQCSKLDGKGGSVHVDSEHALNWNDKDLLWVHLDVQEPTAIKKPSSVEIERGRVSPASKASVATVSIPLWCVSQR